MPRSFLLAAVLAASALPAHAATWTFSYQGFHDSVTDRFAADRRIVGSFTGHDSDGDGAIIRSEITSFVLNGYDYVGCESQSNQYWQCGTGAFAFRNGALSFTAGEAGSDPEGWVGGGHIYIAGDREFGYRFRPGVWDSWAYSWTPQTTFAISLVPEPGTWALLLAGAPLVALAARRRRK